MTSDTPRPDCVSLVSRALAALALLAPLDAPLLFLTGKGVPRQSLGRVLGAGDQTTFLPQTKNLENVSVWDDVHREPFGHCFPCPVLVPGPGQ